MEQNETRTTDEQSWRPTNPHDRFCRHTVFHPMYAPDFLQSFGGPVLTKCIDMDHLQAASTSHLSDKLREVLTDASLATRLQDANSQSEVLLFLEHKSRPSRTVALQLLAEAVLSLYQRWISSHRSESRNVKLPIPLMVVVYNGSEDWEGEIYFQDLFPDLLEELRPYVPQFKLFFINLRRYQYGCLPGRPETQAVVESLMRATDGTFIEHLSDILKHVAEADLNESLRLSLTKTISTYCTWTARATSEQIINAISTVFRGQEYIKMIEEINNSFILEGIAIGEARGEAKGKINAILTLLHDKFHPVPDEIADELHQRTDLIALDSLIILAAHCKTIDEFTNGLK